MAYLIPPMDDEPPHEYLDFVSVRLGTLRSEASRLVGGDRQATEVYMEVLTDLAGHWRRLCWRSRLSHRDAIAEFLDRRLATRTKQWREEQIYPVEVSVLRPPRAPFASPVTSEPAGHAAGSPAAAPHVPDFYAPAARTPDFYTPAARTPDFYTSAARTPDFYALAAPTPDFYPPAAPTPDFYPPAAPTRDFYASAAQAPGIYARDYGGGGVDAAGSAGPGSAGSGEARQQAGVAVAAAPTVAQQLAPLLPSTVREETGVVAEAEIAWVHAYRRYVWRRYCRVGGGVVLLIGYLVQFMSQYSSPG
jgi:hypothetical protein